MALFLDRRDAGKHLAKELLQYWGGRNDIVVLAMPRGGVAVAFDIARTLNAPLDLMLVRKLGVPGQEEVAMGALALPDVCVFNRDVIENALVSQRDIDRAVARESKELQRRNSLYRHGEPPPDLKGKVVILVDDGVATGADMRAAISAVSKQRPLQIVVAVPIAAKQALEVLRQSADEVVCLHTPIPFFGVGQAYEDFTQAEDQEVLSLLEQARQWSKGKLAGEHNHVRAAV